jgi:hypothetical protein
MSRHNRFQVNSDALYGPLTVLALREMKNTKAAADVIPAKPKA